MGILPYIVKVFKYSAILHIIASMSEKRKTLIHMYQIFSQNCPFLQEIFFPMHSQNMQYVYCKYILFSPFTFFPLFRLLPFFPPFALFSAFPPFNLFPLFRSRFSVSAFYPYPALEQSLHFQEVNKHVQPLRVHFEKVQ